MDVMNFPDIKANLNLESEFTHESGYVETIQFESGKKRNYLKNSYVPLRYPLSILLDEEEAKIFKNWFEITLRYGILPFYLPRLSFRSTILTRTPEMGIYSFIPDTLNIDRLDGITQITFEVEELGFLPEIQYIFLSTHDGKILLTHDNKFMVA